MRFLIATAFVILVSSLAFSDESHVFKCHFEDETYKNSIVLMKKYYDTVQGMYLGKVDLLKDSVKIESTPTKVYEIPIQDQQFYMQIWYASNLRVDAQLDNDQGFREFRAKYSKDTEKYALICRELQN
ncbi:MAG: cell wall hydrolase [Pseudobdellovibrionaceae bacterium]